MTSKHRFLEWLGKTPQKVESLFRLGHGLHGESEPTRDSSRLLPLVLAEIPEKTGYLLVQITHKWRQYGSVRNIAGLLSEVSLQLGRSLQKTLILIGATTEYQLIGNGTEELMVFRY